MQNIKTNVGAHAFNGPRLRAHYLPDILVTHQQTHRRARHTYTYLLALCLYKSRYAVGGVRRKLGFKMSNAAERASPASHFLAPFPTRLLPTSIPWKRSPSPTVSVYANDSEESECTSRTNRECSSKLKLTT